MIVDQIIRTKAQNTRDSYTTEKPLRSVIKAVSWRLIGTLDTITISWLLTGELTLAFSIGSIELFTKMLLYFFHERMWNQIKWGK